MKAKAKKSQVRIRVLRECTTQWTVFGAIAMDGDRFVPFLSLWPASNDKAVPNEIKQTCGTLREAVAAILVAKQNAEQFIRAALASGANGVPR